MKAERTLPRTAGPHARIARGVQAHFEAHFSRDGDLADSRKGPRTSSVEGSLPSSLANRYFDYQKTKGAGSKPPREAARSFNSLNFALRFGSGSPLPLNQCLKLRLSIYVSCPSLPPKRFIADKVRSNEQTISYMAAHGCHFVGCSLYVLFVNIKMFPSCRAQFIGASCFV